MNGDRHRNRSLICAIRGPIMLITIGVLFTLDHFTQYTFWDKTWPVLIIVIGLLSLMRRGLEPAPPTSPTAPFPPPQYAYPQYPPPAGGGSYAQSPYAQPAPEPAAPSKGGFGTSAPQSTSTESRPAQPPANGENPL
jgi:hypothetical protein